MKNLIFSLVVTVLLFGSVSPQESAKTLTNQDVIEMTKSELPESVIISKIKSSKVSFKTEIDDLKNLAAEKVPEQIISAMIEKSAEKVEEPPAIQSTWDSPEYGKIEELKDATKVMVIVDDIKARQIIIEELAKYPRLTIVDNKKESEFIITFRIGSSDRGASVIGRSITKDVVVVGELYAIRRGRIEDNKQYQRIVWQTRKTQDFSGGITISRHPATNAIREFIKDLKKLRNEK